MTDTFFDTHHYISQLMASGVPIHEAEAHAKALGAAMDNDLAKKSDLNEFRAEIRGEFNEFRAEIRGEFNEFRTEIRGEFNEFRTEVNGRFNQIRTEFKGQFDLLKWMMGFVLAGMAAMLLKIF